MRIEILLQDALNVLRVTMAQTVPPSVRPEEGVYNCGSDGDIVCVEDTRDPSTRCTQCLTGRNPTTNCTSCLPDYIGDNCVMGTSNRVNSTYKL